MEPSYPALKQLLLALASERSLPSLLQRITSGLAEQPDVALARVWLIEPGDICDACPRRDECPQHVPCLQLVASYTSYIGLERENLELRRQIETSYRRAFPKGALVDAEKQVKRQLDALRGTAQSSGFTSLMNRAGEVVASKPGARITSLSYNEKGGEMRMNITAQDFEAVESIRTAMTENGLNAVMETSNAQGEQVRARLRVGAGS